jgi:hypothetical protein
MTGKKSNNTRYNKNKVRQGLDNIVNSAKNIAAGAITFGIMGTSIASAQEANTADSLSNSRFSATPPYTVIKPGENYDLNNGRQPNGKTYFLVRADYDLFMKQLKAGQIPVSEKTANDFYSLLADVRQSSIFEKIGQINKVDGEEISKQISLDLGNYEKIKYRDSIIFKDGIWNPEETSNIARMIMSKGHEAMWAIYLRQAEGYDDNLKKYVKFADLSLVLIETQNYKNAYRQTNGKKTKEPKVNNANPADTVLTANEALGLFVGLGADYLKSENKTILQAEIGLEAGKWSLGVKSGYDKYMKSYHDPFPNGQNNGRTDIYKDVTTQVVQIGPELGFDISKNVELCLGAQNNIINKYTTGTQEQLNINPETGENRFLKTDLTPKNEMKNYWTLDPGLKLRIKWFGVYANVKYDIQNKKFDGYQAGVNIHF